MDEADRIDSCSAYRQLQAKIFARLLPASECEKRLVQQMVVCRYKLEQIENRLTKVGYQLQKMYEELKHEPLP